MSLGTAATAIATNTIVRDMHVTANDETFVCKLVARQPEVVEGKWCWGAKGNFKEQLGVKNRAGKRLRRLQDVSHTAFSPSSYKPLIIPQNLVPFT